MLGFGFKVSFDGVELIHLDDWNVYDTEEEAMESAKYEVDYIIKNEDGYEGENPDDFEIEIVEIEE